jgi:phosphonopyruvate decarboxylase
MIDPIKFYEYLIYKKITFFTGVPDSLLKEFNDVLLSNVSSDNHIITPNEGSAIAIASGYNIATGGLPLIYLQNSGFGNAVNPLMSLTSNEVYSIPMILLVGWRGSPDISDEPQHKIQGGCMEELIKSLNINYHIMNSDTVFTDLIDDIVKETITSSRPTIILVKKNTFSKATVHKTKLDNGYPLYRRDVIKNILNVCKDDVIVSTTGKISRELMECKDEIGLVKDNIFLNVGAMGHVSMIAAGISINTSKRVICMDGDGSAIMHMGNMALIGKLCKKNMIHIVLNNGMHESVGCQPTVGFDIDFVKIAYGCGYEKSIQITTQHEFDEVIEMMSDFNFNKNGSTFIEIRINGLTKEIGELSRPKETPVERKKKFIKFLNEN